MCRSLRLRPAELLYQLRTVTNRLEQAVVGFLALHTALRGKAARKRKTADQGDRKPRARTHHTGCAQQVKGTIKARVPHVVVQLGAAVAPRVLETREQGIAAQRVEGDAQHFLHLQRAR